MAGVLLVGSGLVVLLLVVVDEGDGGGEEVEEGAQCRGVRWIVEIVGMRSRLWRRQILRRRIRHG